ncbi:MAG TPA: hypothetical protein PLT16_01420 [Daejeonella sp.]|nr:hypothetical protein [Daejeonella sp.]
MGKDGVVFISEGALTVPGDEGHGVVSLAGAMGTANGVCFPVIKRKSGKRKNKGMLQEE